MSKNIVSYLQESGFRTTKSRLIICDFIEKHSGIFCANDILNTTNKLDKASLYRTLDILESLEIITPLIRIDGQQFYERFDDNKKGHHHHVLCKHCKKTKCVSCSIESPDIPGFSHIIHSSIFIGICTTCH